MKIYKYLFILLFSLNLNAYETSDFINNFKYFKDKLFVGTMFSNHKTKEYTFDVGLYNPFNEKCCTTFSLYRTNDKDNNLKVYGFKINSDLKKNLFNFKKLNLYLETFYGLGKENDEEVLEGSVGVGTRLKIPKTNFYFKNSVNYIKRNSSDIVSLNIGFDYKF